MRVKEIISNLHSLNSMKEKKMQFIVSYAISKNIEAFEQEAKRVEEHRIKLCEDRAKKDKNGVPVTEGVNYVFENETDAKWINEEYNKVLEEDIDVDVIKISAEQIATMEQDERYDLLSVEELGKLMFMIE